MRTLAKILVEKRFVFFTISVVLAILFAFCINSVTLNKDDTKYLDPESGMGQGLKIMETEFPIVEVKDSFQIMFEGLTATEKEEIHKDLLTFEGVKSVDYDANSANYNSKVYSMFVVHTEYAGDNNKVSALIQEMTKRYSKTYTVYSYYQGAYLDVLDKLIPMAAAIGITLLLLLCKSYFEPLLLLVSIGVAVLINMGSNIIFESVSEMTFSIAAVLQLVLSIDYSIMLIHRFEQEYKALEVKDACLAMKNAIVNAFSSIVSSSITTIVGLLVLLLMSFTIGTDIGLVLSKGVFLSLVCVFTVMPTVIIWGHELLFKTNKQYLREKKLTAGGATHV